MESKALYASSKAAVDTLTQFAAIEGAPLHVRVNAINPGITGAPMPPTTAQQWADMAADATLVGSPNSAEELAAFVLFVADNKTGRFFNGSLLKIDGGMGVK